MSLLVARQITHAYRRGLRRAAPCLADVEFTLQAGECWGLLGPNGSGKSTLLRVLAGLCLPLTGQVLVQGHAAGSAAARAATGFVPEALEWPATLSVQDALAELAALRSPFDIGARLERVARPLGLLPLLRCRLGSLSLGQARRVVLAQALLDDPPLLLLDEAFSGLDSLVLHDLREDLRLRLLGGGGVLLASHRLDDLEGLATHVLVLHQGRVVQRGPADEVLAGCDGRQGLSALLGGPA